MKLMGSKRAVIECDDCFRHSPPFRVYLYDDDDGYCWDGKIPKGWKTYKEVELYPDGVVLGSCSQHCTLLMEM